MVAVPSGLIIPKERATHGPRRATHLRVIRLSRELRMNTPLWQPFISNLYVANIYTLLGAMDRHLLDNLHRVVAHYRKLRWGEDQVKEGGA